MNCNRPTLKASLLILTIICISTFLHATTPKHYPPINDELGKLLVEGMTGLMKDFPLDDPDFPTFTDEHYRARLLELSGEIQYRLNDDIKNHIIHRTERYRTATERTLGLSEMYFPIFEEYLAKKDIPHHIKYLPIVESNLNAVAKSHAAAVGLWQFIPETGRLYNLTVASHLDERSDTHKASEAAATMLSFLFKRYDDWGLALAAYNCGPGRVDKYVKGTNGKTFWDIRSYLPKETQMYVPYFMAVAYSYEFHELHELKALHLPSDLVLTDSIHLEPGYVTLSDLSRKYDISRDTLNRLNPSYIKGYAPSGSRTNILVLPARIVAKHRGYEDSYNEIMSMRTENPIKCIRRINTEDDLALLMKAHRFNRQDLLFWNGLPSNYKVKQGDVIAVRKYYVPKDAWVKEEAKINIESISIASLKVVGLDDNKKKALTAPVYVAVKTPKLSDNVSTAALIPANTNSTNNKDNLYNLKNTTTALPAQKVKEQDILAEVSENRDRSRRLRSTEPTKKTDEPTVSTPTTDYQKPQMLAVSNNKPEEITPHKITEEEARHKAAIEEAQRNVARAKQERAAREQAAIEEAQRNAAKAKQEQAAREQAAIEEAQRNAAKAKQEQIAREQAAIEEAQRNAAKAKQEQAAREQAAIAEAQYNAAKAKQEQIAREQAAIEEAQRNAAKAKQEQIAREQAAIEEAQRNAAVLAAQEAKIAAAILQVSQETEALQAKDQAVVKAKVYEKTSTEEMAALAHLQDVTKKLKEERLSKPTVEPKEQPLEQVYEYYTIKNNETIWEIAKQYPAVSAQEIMTLNNIKTETILRTGTVLKIRAK